MAFAGDPNKQGSPLWILCDGASKQRKELPELFAAIQTAWGAKTESSFSIPDLRGEFLRGADQGKGTDPDLAARQLAKGASKSKSGVAEVSLALKLIMEDGSQLEIQYHEFVSPMKFDGATLIEISTPTLSIKINGKNLQSIFDYLMEHRLVWIKEPDSSMVETKEGEAEIEKIEIEEDKPAQTRSATPAG